MFRRNCFGIGKKSIGSSEVNTPALANTSLDNAGNNLSALISKLIEDNISKSRPVLDVELSGYQIIQTLMEKFINAAVHPERFYSKHLISRVSSQYDIDAPDLETRIMAIIDYISGMTDVYALDVYQKINGISLPII